MLLRNGTIAFADHDGLDDVSRELISFFFVEG